MSTYKKALVSVMVLITFFFILTGIKANDALALDGSGQTPLQGQSGVSIENGFNNSANNASNNSTSNKSDLSAQVDLSEMRSFLSNLDADLQASLPEFSLTQLFDSLKEGSLNLDPQELGKSLLKLLAQEFIQAAPLIGKLLILAVLCAVLQQLQIAFAGEIGKLAQIMTYLVLLGLALTSFQAAIDVAKGAIDNMVGLVQTAFPVLFTLLIAMGNITSAALLKPVVLGSLSVLVTLLKNIVLPLFFLGAVLKLFNQISSQFKLKKLAGLIEFAGKVSLGLVLTSFLGVMAVQGVTGGVADSVALRTAKYSADLIPVVGKFFKDAVELVVSSGLLLKNAVGIIAIIAIIMICIGPILKIVAMIFVFKISAAIVEPLGQSDLAESLQGMSQSLIYVFAVLASVTIMFFMTVAVIVGAGNLSVMMR